MVGQSETTNSELISIMKSLKLGASSDSSEALSASPTLFAAAAMLLFQRDGLGSRIPVLEVLEKRVETASQPFWTCLHALITGEQLREHLDRCTTMFDPKELADWAVVGDNPDVAAVAVPELVELSAARLGALNVIMSLIANKGLVDREKCIMTAVQNSRAAVLRALLEHGDEPSSALAKRITAGITDAEIAAVVMAESWFDRTLLEISMFSAINTGRRDALDVLVPPVGPLDNVHSGGISPIHRAIVTQQPVSSDLLGYNMPETIVSMNLPLMSLATTTHALEVVTRRPDNVDVGPFTNCVKRLLARNDLIGLSLLVKRGLMRLVDWSSVPAENASPAALHLLKTSGMNVDDWEGFNKSS